jgi:hypothetical protein
MPYTIRQIKDIPKWLLCPLCSYETNLHNSLIKHLDKCEEYDGDIDDIKFYNISENLTIGDYIRQQLHCINITKKLIKTNELDLIKEMHPTDIRLFIRNKLLENTEEYSEIDGHIFNIYMFFFGESEENNEVFCEKMCEYINRRHH